MTETPTAPEPDTNPDAADDPLTDTPGSGEPDNAPVDNPSGKNDIQGDDVASGGS